MANLFLNKKKFLKKIYDSIFPDCFQPRGSIIYLFFQSLKRLLHLSNVTNIFFAALQKTGYFITRTRIQTVDLNYPSGVDFIKIGHMA
jgi:hypothetical protein